MTREEFDLFLQNEVEIKNWKGTKIDSSYFFSFEEGWFALTAQLIKDCLAAGWDGDLHQSKEKFGGLRFYIGSGSEEIWKIIQKAEGDSYDVCEMCGTTEQIGHTRGWISTFCKPCAEKVYSEKNIMTATLEDWWKPKETPHVYD
jgi:hypothetical protein